MFTLHKEINFENDICNHLAANGCLYAEGDAAQSSSQNALDRAALNSSAVQADVLRLLLGPARLWESLRERSP